MAIIFIKRHKADLVIIFWLNKAWKEQSLIRAFYKKEQLSERRNSKNGTETARVPQHKDQQHAHREDDKPHGRYDESTIRKACHGSEIYNKYWVI